MVGIEQKEEIGTEKRKRKCFIKPQREIVGVTPARVFQRKMYLKNI